MIQIRFKDDAVFGFILSNGTIRDTVVSFKYNESP